MKNHPYLRFKEADLTLRDELAIDRTLLANERTLLAYLRSGMALIISGITILNFSPTDWFWGIGLACEPLGVAAMFIGIRRFRTMQASIRTERNAEQAVGSNKLL